VKFTGKSFFTTTRLHVKVVQSSEISQLPEMSSEETILAFTFCREEHISTILVQQGSGVPDATLKIVPNRRRMVVKFSDIIFAVYTPLNGQVCTRFRLS
jgi:hypothetical protein